jgi:hypothetical protein
MLRMACTSPGGDLSQGGLVINQSSLIYSRSGQVLVGLK